MDQVRSHYPRGARDANFRKTSPTKIEPFAATGKSWNMAFFWLRIGETEGSPTGTPINVFSELMLDGSPHPRRWPRLRGVLL